MVCYLRKNWVFRLFLYRERTKTVDLIKLSLLSVVTLFKNGLFGSYGVSSVLASISLGAFVLVRPVREEDPDSMDLGARN